MKQISRTCTGPAWALSLLAASLLFLPSVPPFSFSFSFLPFPFPPSPTFSLPVTHSVAAGGLEGPYLTKSYQSSLAT